MPPQASKIIDRASELGRYLDDNLKYTKRLPPAALQRQAILSFGGNGTFGQMLGNTTVPVNEATQTQTYIVLYYQEEGLVYPEDLDAVLKSNPGPNLPWNYSYAQWGVTA